MKTVKSAALTIIEMIENSTIVANLLPNAAQTTIPKTPNSLKNSFGKRNVIMMMTNISSNNAATKLSVN
jgi:hypothetical protein